MMKMRMSEVANSLRKIADESSVELVAQVLMATNTAAPLIRRAKATLKVATLEKGIETLGIEMSLNYLIGLANGDSSAVWIYRNCK